MTDKPKAKRGFATLSPERRREIASMGGKAIKPENRQFSKNKALAVSAGRKGGTSVDPEKRSFSRNRELASKAGMKGALGREKEQ
jgi:general stress protein YciG